MKMASTISKMQTLVVIKPDGVERNLIGEIIARFEAAGLVVRKLRMLNVPEDLIQKHYVEDEDYLRSVGEKAKNSGQDVPDTVEYGRKIVIGLRKYMTDGPVVAMVLEGEDAVALVRKVTGFTDPTRADKGTIRGDFGQDSFEAANAEGRPTRNMIHASGNPEEAEAEIALWSSIF